MIATVIMRVIEEKVIYFSYHLSRASHQQSRMTLKWGSSKINVTGYFFLSELNKYIRNNE
jgi:hypothetical protein